MKDGASVCLEETIKFEMTTNIFNSWFCSVIASRVPELKNLGQPTVTTTRVQTENNILLNMTVR